MSVAKSLTKEQVDQIQGWADEGASLSEIQARLASEMDVKVTYMEVRFLIDDIGVTLLPEEKPEPPEEEEETSVEEASKSDLIADPSEPGKGGSVTVTISELQRPGAMVSGQVVFANGQKAEWYLDQSGRIGMDPENSEYRPTEEELKDFQEELQRVAKQKGF